MAKPCCKSLDDWDDNQIQNRQVLVGTEEIWQVSGMEKVKSSDTTKQRTSDAHHLIK